MKTKQKMRFEIKEISAEGSFEGLLSPYGVVDQGGDMVEPGAYTKTLQDRGNERPLLWQHKQDEPIGTVWLEDRPDGLWCKGQLLMDLPTAKKAYLLIKARVVKGLSIGYESIRDVIEDGVRHLKEVALWEGSIVTFPMALSAQITAVKGAGIKSDFNEELSELQLMDGGWQMQCALSCALDSIRYSTEMTRDEKISAAEATIQQFSEAYLAYLPQYLDMMSAESAEGMESMGKDGMETKAGRKISASTRASLKAACDHTKSAMETLLALLTDDAGEDTEPATSDEKAASVEQKSEPIPDHSAVLNAVNHLKETLLWNSSK